MSTEEQIRSTIIETVNEHLKAHDIKTSLTSSNWTKVVGGCKSLNDVADRIGGKLGIDPPTDLTQFKSLDDAVRYAFNKQA
ncbi:hypothetical protein [Luteibacter sp. RCC_6_2]|jgi:hypothetical protein|uniref:hypothetical protein n=1 Tax=Luteibacter sp. RCC_6_2 TaxID=3239223 RepID=UPI003525121E